MDRVLAFDLWGAFAHYKRIYATTSALTYPIPLKTSLYGLVGGILGLEKEENAYLESFKPGKCRIGIQIRAPLRTQQININLRAVFGSMKPTDNRKPTMMEFVSQPRYRIFFTHTDRELFNELEERLKQRRCVYTPSLGLANLLANFEYAGSWEVDSITPDGLVDIHSVIPRRNLERLASAEGRTNQIIEVSQFAIEMDCSRNVTDFDDVLLDRKGAPIFAKVSSAYPFLIDKELQHVILF